jgi:hypothetical protein
MLEQLDVAIGFTVVMLMLSMLITVFVQAVAAAVDLRGRNLVWGLTKLFHQIDPAFQGPVAKGWNEVRSSVGKKLAEAVATHPMLKHALAGRAKAIRVDELITVLEDLASNPPRALNSEATRVLKDWAEKVTPSPEAVALAKALLAKIDASMPGQSQALRRMVEETIGAAGRLQSGIERWFDGVMGRSSDVFSRWTKGITIAGAFALAFGFHVDSIDVYRQVSTNANVRAKLGAIADETAKKAADVLVLDSKRMAAAWERVQANHPAADADKGLPAMPSSIRRCDEAERWISDQSLAATIVAEFTEACQMEALDQLGGVGASLSSIRASLGASGIRIASGGDAEGRSWWRGFWDAKGSFRLGHFFGVLATAVLLSLGAPFWYNALRQFCSLKPASARQIHDEQKQAAPAS